VDGKRKGKETVSVLPGGNEAGDGLRQHSQALLHNTVCVHCSCRRSKLVPVIFTDPTGCQLPVWETVILTYCTGFNNPSGAVVLQAFARRVLEIGYLWLLAKVATLVILAYCIRGGNMISRTHIRCFLSWFIYLFQPCENEG